GGLSRKVRRGAFAHFAGRAPEALAERAIEIGQVVKADRISDVADATVRGQQLSANAVQAFGAHEFGEACSFVLEQFPDVPGAERMPMSHVVDQNLALEMA